MKTLTKTEYEDLMSSDLSEASELYLRHAGIYIESTAVTEGITTRVCKLDAEIMLLLETDAIDASELEEVSYHFSENEMELAGLYAGLMMLHQPSVSV